MCLPKPAGGLFVYLEEVDRSRRAGRLLLGDDRVLDALAQTELERGLGRNLDRLAGLGVAPLASLALRENHLAEAREHEFAVLLNLAGGQVGQFLENLLHLRALEVEFLREVIDHFGL